MSSRALRLLASAAMVATLLMAVSPPTSAAEPSRSDPAPDVQLDRPMRGKAAVSALGSQLDEVADHHGLSTDELREQLVDSTTTWVSETGHLFVVDPSHEASHAGSAVTPAAVQPLDETFALHSKPGSAYTIFLDFDGFDLSTTEWNGLNRDVGLGTQPAWDPDGDGPAFSAGERASIQQVWAGVAEDFAPFDVDVTTADPGVAALTRSSGDDRAYGVRALISSAYEAWSAICRRGCAGVAYLNALTDVDPNAARQPALVFSDALADDPQRVAGVASHEVGHTLGLLHDGFDGAEYYGGDGDRWGPIMGNPSDVPVTQFSAGDYTGSRNREDDVAIIGAALGWRPDSEGTSVADAITPTDDLGVISTRGDQDFYYLGSCSGTIRVDADPFSSQPDLDVELAILDTAGRVVVPPADPPAARVDRFSASGLAASVSATVPRSGVYFARVDGVGVGTPSAGYSDYGSLGFYRVSVVSGCTSAVPPGVPSPPTQLAVTRTTATSVTFGWSPPVDQGSGPITGYVVTREGAPSVTLPADATSHVVDGLRAGTSHVLSVRALNAAGRSAAARMPSTTGAATVPSAPRRVWTTWHPEIQQSHVRWAVPLSDGGSAITRYNLYVDGSQRAYIDGLGTSVGSAVLAQAPGLYDVEVAAQNSAGVGPRTRVLLAVPTLPGAPTGLTASWSRAGGVQASWTAPTETGYAPLSYEVLVDGGPAATVSATAATLRGLSPGDHTVEVRGVNVLGRGPSSTTTVTVPAPDLASAPTGVSAVWDVAHRRASVRWSAPADDGGADVTSYRVYVDGALRASPTVRSAVLPGLAAGARTITIAAVNAAGEGAAARTTLRVPARIVPTAVALRASTRVSARGTRVTLQARVVARTTAARGTVTFLANGRVLGRAAVAADGVATLRTRRLPRGTVRLVARFAPGRGVAQAAAASPTLRHVVRQYRSRVRASAAAVVRRGARLRVTGTVRVVGARSARQVAGRRVWLVVDGARAAKARVRADGSYVLRLRAGRLSNGRHAIRVAYVGSTRPSVAPSTSRTLVVRRR